MKKYFLASLLVWTMSVAPALATISSSPVHEAVGENAALNNNFNITVTAPASGNVEILCYEGGTNSISVTSVTQTNVTWAGAADVANTTGAGRHTEIWHGVASGSAGTTVTVNLSGSPALSNAGNVTEWSSTGGLTADATNKGTANSATVDAGSITPTAGRNALLISCMRLGAAYISGPTTATAAFVRGSSPDSGVRGETNYVAVTSTSGAYSTTDTTNSSLWSATIASFVEPATATNVAPRFSILKGLLSIFGTLTIK